MQINIAICDDEQKSLDTIEEKFIMMEIKS